MNLIYKVRYHALDDDEDISIVSSSKDGEVSDMDIEEDEEALPDIDGLQTFIHA